MGIGVIEFVLVHIGICFVFGVFCCVWYWREKRSSRARRRISEQAAARFFEGLDQSAPANVAASRVPSEPAIHERPIIPFLAILPDCTLVLAALDKDAHSDTAPITPPTTRPRSFTSEASTAQSQSVQPSEPPSSSHIVYVPPPQPQYIPPDRPARYPIQPPQLPQSRILSSQISTSASGRLRRFGILRMPSYRRADLEGIPSSLIWSIVTVELRFCPWARPTSHSLSRSGSSTRLTAPSRSFRTLYGALGLLRGNSSSASRSTATHPFHDDGVTHATSASPSHGSRTSMLGWRAPYLHGLRGEMAISVHEEFGEGAGDPGVSEAITATTRDVTGNPPGLSRSLWLGSSDYTATETLQATLAAPWPSDRGMSLGNAIRLLELPVQGSIPEAGHPEPDTLYGAQ